MLFNCKFSSCQFKCDSWLFLNQFYFNSDSINLKSFLHSVTLNIWNYKHVICLWLRTCCCRILTWYVWIPNYSFSFMLQIIIIIIIIKLYFILFSKGVSMCQAYQVEGIFLEWCHKCVPESSTACYVARNGSLVVVHAHIVICERH